MLVICCCATVSHNASLSPVASLATVLPPLIMAKSGEGDSYFGNESKSVLGRNAFTVRLPDLNLALNRVII